MLVHLTASTHKLDDDLPYLRRIVEATYDVGAVLAYDWIKPYEAIRHTIKHEDIDWKVANEANADAINRADIVIIEATTFSFSQGYQAGLALHAKKPTLVVSRLSLATNPISRMKNKYLTIKEYTTEAELEKVVSKFIKSNIIATKDLRFNLFIDRKTHNYLRDYSYETGKNKSEIIRQVLLREIEREEE
jgi:hypothetical protein